MKTHTTKKGLAVLTSVAVAAVFSLQVSSGYAAENRSFVDVDDSSIISQVINSATDKTSKGKCGSNCREFTFGD